MLFGNLRLFQEVDNGGGTGDANGGDVDAGEKDKQAEENKPAAKKGKAAKKEESDAVDKGGDELAAALKRAEEAEKKAAELEKAKKDAEEAERQKNLTAEQKAAELEQKLKEKDRAILIEQVRRSNGFSDKVYDVVRPEGDTEDEIKKAFESHKTALDEFVKASGAKPGQGEGTGGSKTPSGKSAAAGGKTYLEQIGWYKPKTAV